MNSTMTAADGIAMSAATQQTHARSNAGKSADRHDPLVGRKAPVAVARSENEAVLTVDGRGMIYECNRAAEKLFKYRRAELVWQNITLLVPEWQRWALVVGGQPNPRLRYLCRIGYRFEVVTKDGAHIASEICFNLLDAGGYGRLSLIVHPVAEATGTAGPHVPAAV